MSQRLLEELNYRFQKPELLQAALTHPTFVNEHPESGPHYERLEFLGDAAVGFLVAEALYAAFPTLREGELTRMRAHAVCQKQLAERARELGLGPALRLGESLRDIPSGPGDSILSDAFEALVGALLIDAGIDTVRQIVGPRLARALGAGADASLRDAKTELQEEAHRQGFAPPHYELVSVSGPAHARRYAVRVTVGWVESLPSEGTSKKRAEQVCAGRALEQIQIARATK